MTELAHSHSSYASLMDKLGSTSMNPEVSSSSWSVTVTKFGGTWERSNDSWTSSNWYCKKKEI